jgi:hypothetical protein
MVDDVENDTLCDGSVSGTEVELEDANDMEVGLFFDASDNLIYTANEIDAATLPQQVTNLISSNYASYTLDTEAETMTFADGSVWYEVVIEDTAANSALELTISEGTVVCSEPYDDED